MKTNGAKDTTDKPKTTEAVNVLFSIPIKQALERVANDSSLSLSDVIRVVVLRHTAEDFPEFPLYAHEETEAFKQKLSETK
jgi:hypothetical protein